MRFVVETVAMPMPVVPTATLVGEMLAMPMPMPVVPTATLVGEMLCYAYVCGPSGGVCC